MLEINEHYAIPCIDDCNSEFNGFIVIHRIHDRVVHGSCTGSATRVAGVLLALSARFSV
jgi:hypothetical protein